MNEAPGRLVLGPAVMHQLGRYAEVSLRAGVELCGILIGTVEGTEALVAGCAQLPNVSGKPETEYQFHPGQQAEAWERAEEMGLQVLGVWHTHPTGPPVPSQTDVAYMQSWLLYPILVPEVGKYMMNVFKLRSMVYEQADDTVLGEPIEHSQWERVPHELRRKG